MSIETSLVATLGGQPQVITFSLDLLIERGIRFDHVIILYLASNPRYRQARDRLAGEFAGDRYAGRSCHLRSLPVRLGDEDISEAITPAQVDAVWRAFDSLFAELKRQEQHVHLSLTGGRRIMALLGFSCAMLHFTPNDRVWHLYTPPDVTERVRDGAVMHLAEDAGQRLISVPLVPWPAYFPGLKPLLGLSPQQLPTAGLPWQDEAERQRCHQVWEALSTRQREALKALVRSPSRQQAAAALHVAPSTLDSHKQAIFDECSKVWVDDHPGRLDVEFLKERFGPFLTLMD